MPSLPALTFPYAMVETALVRLHNIAPEDVSAFRARFGSLQRAGLLGAENRPGKGIKLVYGHDQIHRVVLAFELVQCGIAPSVFLPMIEQHWAGKLRDIFVMAERANARETSDVVLILAGVAALSTGSAVPNINHTTMDKISERLLFALDGKSLPARVLLVNLSAQLRKFHEALAHYHLRPEPLVEATRMSKGKRRPAKR